MASVPEKKLGLLRVVSFNVNGVRTVFDYLPWREDPTVSGMMKTLQADVLCLQELKTARPNITNALGQIEGVSSFVTVPVSKKGYSGVALYIRKPRESDSLFVKQLLTVRKAEEGISGYLQCMDYKRSPLAYADIESLAKRYAGTLTDSECGYSTVAQNLVGSYVKIFSRERCLELDSQGRACIVELGYGYVIIGVYCPANSQGSQEGELFREDFLKLLFARARALEKAGKSVMILGDINVSRDLIDSAEGIQSIGASASEDFEQLHEAEAIKFAKRSVPAVHVNCSVFEGRISSKNVAIDAKGRVLDQDENGMHIRYPEEQDLFVGSDDEDDDGYEDGMVPIKDIVENLPFLHDVVREKCGRIMRLYTCWNTQKNHRSINFGSRIDLILCGDLFEQHCEHAGVLRRLNGSDHCPIYADFNFGESEDNEVIPSYIPKFEARYMYGLSNRTILNMFKNFSQNSILAKRSPEVEIVREVKKKKEDQPIQLQTNKKLEYTSMKGKSAQRPISSFFNVKGGGKKEKEKEQEKKENIENIEKKQPKNTAENVIEKAKTPPKSGSNLSSLSSLGKLQENAPKCRHNKPCILKTSMTNKNKGRKFWCCSKVSTGDKSAWDENTNCGYFAWK